MFSVDGKTTDKLTLQDHSNTQRIVKECISEPSKY